MTIRDIEKGTSIRASYIESIEKGDYAQLPGEVYVKGFIRNYANFLKLDADALVKQYVAETNPEAAKPEPEEESKLEDTVKTTTAKPAKYDAVSRYYFSSSSGSGLFIWLC